MIYDRQRFQQSERRLVEEEPPFTFTAERRAALDELLTKYPRIRSVPPCSPRLCWSRSNRDI